MATVVRTVLVLGLFDLDYFQLEGILVVLDPRLEIQPFTRI